MSSGLPEPPVGFVGPVIARKPVMAVQLAELAGLLFVAGFAFEADYVCRALFGAAEGATAWIPWVGKKVSGGLHKVEQRLDHALGRAEQELTERIGALFHGLAEELLDTLYLVAGVILMGYYLEWLLIKKFHVAALEPAIHRIEKIGKAQTHTIGKVATKVGHTAAELKAPSTGTIARAITLKLRPLKVELRHFERHTELELKRLRLRPGRAEPARGRPAPEPPARTVKRGTDQGKRIGRLEGILTVAGLGWLVHRTIGRAGGGWIFCRNWNRVGRNVCGMSPDVLDALLLGTLAIGSLLSVETFARACLAAEGEVTPLIKRGVKELRVL